MIDNGHYRAGRDADILNSNRVTLLTSSLSTGLVYTLTINNVEDLLTGYPIAVNTMGSFQYMLPASIVTLLFDFGSASFITTGAWNNVTSASTGLKVADAVDTQGTAQGIQLSILDDFPGINTVGVQANTFYPVSAQRDSMFVTGTGGVGAGNTQAIVRISNLSPSNTYDFTFFASRETAGGLNRTSLYTIAGTTVFFNASNNTTNRGQHPGRRAHAARRGRPEGPSGAESALWLSGCTGNIVRGGCRPDPQQNRHGFAHQRRAD